MNIKKTIDKALHRRSHDSGLLHQTFMFLLLVLIATALVGAVWNEFPETKPFQDGRAARYQNQQANAYLGRTYQFEGTVVVNVTKDAAFDGPAYAVVDVGRGVLYAVRYSEGIMPCQNASVTGAGFDLREGDRVLVRGVIREDGISVCDTPDAYINVQEDGQPEEGASADRVAEWYFDGIRAKCADSDDGTSAACCESSVDHMRDGGFIEAVGGSCPSGYVKNMLRCPTSRAWCEPEPGPAQ